MCVTEICNELSKLHTTKQTLEADTSDPSSFVTVIAVNGLKSTTQCSTQTPPKYNYFNQFAYLYLKLLFLQVTS